MAETGLELATFSGQNNETQPQPEPLRKLLDPLQPSDTRRVSTRTTNGPRPFRYNPTNYCLFILFILFCFDTVGYAASLPLWSKEITIELQILKGSILWHLCKRANFRTQYQFLTVVYKFLPPLSSGGKYFGKGLFNKTKINAPSWYTDWEHEIEL